MQIKQPIMGDRGGRRVLVTLLVVLIIRSGSDCLANDMVRKCYGSGMECLQTGQLTWSCDQRYVFFSENFHSKANRSN